MTINIDNRHGVITCKIRNIKDEMGFNSHGINYYNCNKHIREDAKTLLQVALLKL